MKRDSYFNVNRLSGVGYLILLGVLAVMGARYSASNYFAQEAVRSDGSITAATTAIRFQSDNPTAYEALALEQLQRREFSSASEAYSKAVSLSPNNYRLWLGLARARALAGESGSAETAFLRAVDLAPHYSQPRMELGRMYLQLGRTDAAFEYLAAAAELDQSHFAEVLKSANLTYGDNPEAIERVIAPKTAKGKSIVAWYFMDRAWMTEKTRSFLLSDEPTAEEKNTAIRFLKEKKNYSLAREIWLSRLMSEGKTTGGTAVIFDGGFESTNENDPSGLGWQVDREIPATATALDRKDVLSGSTALHVRFAGNVESQRPIVSQIAPVEPGKRYTLEFFILAGELVSAGLPEVLVVDPNTNSILGRSDPIEDSKGIWVRRSVTFTAPSKPAVLVSLQRPACPSQPCPIFGSVSIDNISITALDR